ncbi:hypothetical protein [Haloechinothrix alba]|nr:hypothetical protein [Haloechinothrix alba]
MVALADEPKVDGSTPPLATLVVPALAQVRAGFAVGCDHGDG